MTTIRDSSTDIDAAAPPGPRASIGGRCRKRTRPPSRPGPPSDPRRAGAYAKALAVSAHLDRARGLGTDFAPAAHPAAKAADRRRLLTAGGMLAAASVVGAVGYGALSLKGRVTTAKGDIRRAPLADGSAVTLNTDTTIRASFDGRMRRVDLLRGEALFDVAKDPARPFVVVAGDVRVRAVGTSFTVRTHADGEVGVIVREGVVEVWRGAGSKPVRLSAEHAVQVAVTGALTPTTIGSAAVDRAMAWRQGQIDLDGLTLGQAATEFARYSDRRVVIDDPAVASLKMTGLFSASDPDGFAKAAALSLGLTATPQADGVRLSRG